MYWIISFMSPIDLFVLFCVSFFWIGKTEAFCTYWRTQCKAVQIRSFKRWVIILILGPRAPRFFLNFLSFFRWPNETKALGTRMNHTVFVQSISCTLYWISGRTGYGKIFGLRSCMAYGPSAARSVHHDREPNIFPSSPPT